MLPGSVKSEPEPKFIISFGKAPEFARSRMTSLNSL